MNGAITYDQMRDLLREQATSIASAVGKSAPAAASGATSTGTSGFNSTLNSLSGGFSNALSATTKFATGTYKATDALANFSQVSGLLGKTGSTIGSFVTQVGEGALAINESLKSSSQQGAYFGNNLGLYSQAVLGARMSMPEWEQTIKQSSKSIAGLGVNMDVSSIGFLKLGKRLQEQDFSYQLQATGVNTEEFGKILTLVAHNAKQSDMTQVESRKKMIQSAIDMAREMDNTARITGISRQEQQESLERQLKSKESELAMLAMSEDERTAYQNNLTMTKRYGDSVQDAIKIYSTGGPMNAEETQKIVALGPEMADAARRLSEVKGTGEEDNAKREAIRQEMDAIVLRKQGDKAFAEEQMRLYKAGDAQTKAMAQSQLEQIRYAQILKRQQEEAQRQGMSLAEYQKTAQAKVEYDREMAAKSKGGTEGDASITSTTINQGERLIKDISAGVGVGMNSLNKEVGATIGGFSDLNKVLKKWTSEEMVQVPQQLVNAIAKKVGVDKEVTVPDKEKNKPKMFGGTMGMFNELLHDFGKETTVDLHGKEAVLNEGQLKNLVNSASSAASKGMPDIESTVGNMFGAMKGPMDSMSKGMPDIESTFGNMFGALKGMMPKDAPSIEPPTKGMLNDLQSSLKSELEKVKSAMPTQDSMRSIVTQMQGAMPKMQEAASAVTGKSVSMPDINPDEAMSSMTKGIDELNKRIERLIQAVEDSGDKSVRALKTSGNLIA
jgi:hypothetical protein